MSRRINSTLHAATLEQRLAGLSIAQLMLAARALASDIEQDALCTAVLDELARRVPEHVVEAFAAEIYA